MIPIVTPAEMAAIDAAAPEPVEVLIARAGWAVARSARTMLGGTYGRRVVVIAGKGNNGADGRVAADLLAGRGVRVTVVDPSGVVDDRPFGGGPGPPNRERPDRRSVADSGPTRQHDRRTGVGEDTSEPDAPGVLPPCDLIIDAAFGTGLSRPYTPPRPADPATPVLAVDIPSGISGLTGRRVGDPLPAEVTVTFAALKPGLLHGVGPEYAGRIETVDIGLDTSGARAHLIGADDVAAWLPRPPRDTHKWRSAVRLVAGSPGMAGAADLAAAAALRAGAGYVRRSTPGVDPAAPGTLPTGPIEAVTTASDATDWAEGVLADLDRFAVLAVGPGLGTGTSTAREVARIVTAPVPIVIDGDGLRALGDDPAAVLADRPVGAPPVVLTPHDGEFARLGARPDGDDEPLDAVRDLAARTEAVVLRKGPTTVVAHPDGRVLVTDTGDERLATAGTGDVLTGVIAAFIARGVDPFHAAAAAAWVHGRAARSGWHVGFTASDLPPLVADLLDTMSDNGPHTDER